MSLAEKIRNVQSKIKPIVKDATNPFFKSKYFDINGILAELKPLLVAEGITVLQPLTTQNEKLALQTIVISEDEKLEFICPLPENPDPQKMGSAITYFRRYSLQSLFLLEAEDDDAQSASTPVKTYTPKVQPKSINNSDVPF